MYPGLFEDNLCVKRRHQRSNFFPDQMINSLIVYCHQIRLHLARKKMIWYLHVRLPIAHWHSFWMVLTQTETPTFWIHSYSYSTSLSITFLILSNVREKWLCKMTQSYILMLSLYLCSYIYKDLYLLLSYYTAKNLNVVDCLGRFWLSHALIMWLFLIHPSGISIVHLLWECFSIAHGLV